MPWLIGVLGVLCLCSLVTSAWAITQFRRMRRRQATGDWRTSADRVSLSADEACRQMEELMARLQAFREQTDAAVEARRREMDDLLRRAEQAAQRPSRAPADGQAMPAQRPMVPAAPRRQAEFTHGPANEPDYAEVCRLHKRGVAPVEIARRCGMDIGRVELVLNLQRAGRYESSRPHQAPTD